MESLQKANGGDALLLLSPIYVYRGPRNNCDTSTETKYYYNVNIDCAEKSQSLREKILTMYMGLTLKEC